MKTIRQHLASLPKHIAKRAIANTKTKDHRIHTKSLEQALLQAFVWHRSPEGELFWVDVLAKIGGRIDSWPKLPPHLRPNQSITKPELAKLRKIAKAYTRLMEAAVTPIYRELYVGSYKLVCFSFGIFNFLARVNLDGLRGHYEFRLITGRLTRKDLRALCIASHGAFFLPTQPSTSSLQVSSAPKRG